MRRMTLIVLGLFLLPGFGRSHALAAGQQVVQLHWEEISPLIEGQEIAVVLPDGTYIQGKALAVQEDALELDIKKTSDGKLHPKGKTTIPRAAVSVIELRQMRKFPIGAIAGGVAGYLGGALLGIGIAQITLNDGEDIGVPLLVGMASAIAGAIVGGRVGHNFDRRNTLIKIIPDPAANPGAVPTTGRTTNGSLRNDSESVLWSTMRRLVSEMDRPMPPGEPTPPWPR